MSRLCLFPNVGGEEPGGSKVAAATSLARLWRLLFPARAEWLGPDAAAASEAWFTQPDALAFAWLPEAGLCAWWNDAASAALAEREGLLLAGPEPAAVARVHDKAFAARTCDALGLWPAALRGHVRVFDADALADADAFREWLRDELTAWPRELARGATLKPRIGTSGRGRVRVDDLDDPRWAASLPRLAARGGAVLEPWLERMADYSVQLHVGRDGRIEILGTLELCVSPSGVYRGHRGELDLRGRVVCGADVEGRLLEAASAIARAAHAEGFFGPCGVDAFTFRWDGGTALRPVVEFNARFTAGTVLIGLLQRAQPWLEGQIGSGPDPRAFQFRLGSARAPGELPDAEPVLHLDGGRAQIAFRAGSLAGKEADSRVGRRAASRRRAQVRRCRG